MKMILILLFVVIYASNEILAQINLKASEVSLSIQEKAFFDRQLVDYNVISFNPSELVDSLLQRGKSTMRLEISKDITWVIPLELNDLRSSDFQAAFVSDSGIHEYKHYTPNTYKGFLENGEIARFTIDSNTFFGVIIDLDDKTEIIIEPAYSFHKDLHPNTYVIYKPKDRIDVDYRNFIHEEPLVAPVESVINEVVSTKSSSPICAYYLEIATDADLEYFQAMGSSIASVYSMIFSVLNIIEGVYESTFNLRFVVTFQNVWTTSNNHPYTSNNTSDLLRDLRSEWEANRTDITRDIAHLFTGKSVSGWGRAWRGQVGNSNSYGLSVNRTEMYKTTAHEIGHNLNAMDANLMEPPTPAICECGQSTASVMCQGTKDSNLWFCSVSISQIEPFLQTNINILNNPIPNNINLTGSVSGFNEFQARESITSNQVIESGVTIYKANDIILNGGFEVKIGSEFQMINDDTGCD
jgi:hypothetical protein